MTNYADQHSANVRAQTKKELLEIRAAFPNAAFVHIEAEGRAHEFHPYLTQATDASGTPLCTSEFNAELTDSNLPVVRDVLTWIGYEDFCALAQEVYGQPGHFPSSVLANPGNTWANGVHIYVFNLDALDAYPNKNEGSS